MEEFLPALARSVACSGSTCVGSGCPIPFLVERRRPRSGWTTSSPSWTPRLGAGSARRAGHAAQMAVMAAATHPSAIRRSFSYNGFARLARADDYPAGMPVASMRVCWHLEDDLGQRDDCRGAGTVGRRSAGSRGVVGSCRAFRGHAAGPRSRSPADARARCPPRAPAGCRRRPSCSTAATTRMSASATVGTSPRHPGARSSSSERRPLAASGRSCWARSRSS